MTIIHIFVCLVLILIVLVQQGKGADVGATFGGGGNTVFGASGADSFLTRFTTLIALTFMLTSVFLAVQGRETVADDGNLFKDVPEREQPLPTAPVATPEVEAAKPAEETEKPAEPNIEQEQQQEQQTEQLEQQVEEAAPVEDPKEEAQGAGAPSIDEDGVKQQQDSPQAPESESPANNGQNSG